jgi:propanol-preferring alcohol dehydrogenase
MRAVQLVEIGKPLEEKELPLPIPQEGEILVRILAAGVCHSDVHYRAGISPVGPLPQTLGHEIAGMVERIGAGVDTLTEGDRVCLHYLVTCGMCQHCRAGREQFCLEVNMLGKDCDGGYAEFVVVPARNAVHLPPEVSMEAGAVLMCSSATSFHALRKGRLAPGESVAVFGAGGLGMAAIQLARAFGALDVYAVDINDDKLRRAEAYGAIPVQALGNDPVSEIRRLTQGRGVDVALEVIGLAKTMEQAVQSLAVWGRAVIVGIAGNPFSIDSYGQLLCREAEVIGSADHLLSELPVLVEYLRRGMLDLSEVITQRIPLDADVVNGSMDALETFGSEVRTVIVANG